MWWGTKDPVTATIYCCVVQTKQFTERLVSYQKCHIVIVLHAQWVSKATLFQVQVAELSNQTKPQKQLYEVKNILNKMDGGETWGRNVCNVYAVVFLCGLLAWKVKEVSLIYTK